ncbi:WD40 repeat domain-containing protein [Streptomyces agglomeratus]|nr:hypothetical protein [Streptomyces agglomeratus]
MTTRSVETVITEREAVWSPCVDGKSLALGDRSGHVRLWDVGSRTVTGTLTAHTDCAASMSFSPDGKKLDTGGWDGTVRLWDLARAD